MALEQFRKLFGSTDAASSEDEQMAPGSLEDVLQADRNATDPELVRALQEEISQLKEEQMQLRKRLADVETDTEFDKSEIREELDQFSRQLKGVAVEEKVDRSWLEERIREMAFALADRAWVREHLRQVLEQVEQDEEELEEEMEEFREQTMKDVQQIADMLAGEVENVREQVESQSELADRVSTLEEQQANIGERIQHLREDMKERFDTLQDQMVEHKEAVNGATSTVEDMEGQVSSLKKKQGTLIDRTLQNEDKLESLPELKTTVEELEERVDSLSSEKGGYATEEELEDLRANVSQMSDLLLQISDQLGKK